jgi:quercetin dioxygenase-like cupin family protein
MRYTTTPGQVVHGVACFVLLLALPFAAANADSHGGKALARSMDDPQLEWGPCPEFLPDGCAIAVLHGNPAEPNADIFFKVPGGAEIPRHRHTSAERMVLVSGELEVTYDGQDAVVLRPGDYAYGPPGLPHTGRCASGDPCVLMIAFEEPVDAIPVE